MYKIAITGPESTGKSQLAKDLAHYFKCEWVKEYAREFLEAKEGNYTQDDLLVILKNQLELEKSAGKTQNKYLFCDSDPLVIKIWSAFKYGIVDSKIDSAWINQHYDYHLLLYPDLDWEYDPLRESKNDRHELFRLYKAELDKQKRTYSIIKGREKERLSNAIREVKQYFSE